VANAAARCARKSTAQRRINFGFPRLLAEIEGEAAVLAYEIAQFESGAKEWVVRMGDKRAQAISDADAKRSQ
jgi:hypothetical protein